MNEREIQEYQQFVVLDCVLKNKDLPEILFKNPEITIRNIFYLLIKEELIEKQERIVILTEAGKYERVQFIKKMGLRKDYINIYPDFKMMTSNFDENDIYLP